MRTHPLQDNERDGRGKAGRCKLTFRTVACAAISQALPDPTLRWDDEDDRPATPLAMIALPVLS